MILQFIAIFLIVGFVTGGLKIKFDRFFTILLLLFLLGFGIHQAVDVFLWIILLGAMMILLDNKDVIRKLPKKTLRKLFLLIPALVLVASFFGSWLFVISPANVLLITLGILAVLYGLRLIFIHFKETEYDYQHPKKGVVKFCGFIGPLISGFFIGFLGTSLKPLKMAFAVKHGKMNMKQVYLGNTISTFFAALFAIIWHNLLLPTAPQVVFETFLLGAALWTGIHYTAELTDWLFKNKWRKGFQIIIGIILALASVKIFLLI